ncbi:MAG: hypothetical protein AAF787_04490 [Chloroflexota bacterium]
MADGQHTGQPMQFDFLTREVFDTLIFIVFGFGVIAAIVRLYQDFTRPLPPPDGDDKRSSSAGVEDDTRPRPPSD